MNRHRRQFIGTAVVAPLIFAGCSAIAPKSRYYNETIASVMVSGDKKKLVFFGANHHYVMDLPARLLTILESPYRSRLRAKFEALSAYQGGKVGVVIRLAIDTPEGAGAENNREIVALLSPDGPVQKDATVVWSSLIGFDGLRYRNSQEIKLHQSQSLNHVYEVLVEEYPSEDEWDAYNKSPVMALKKGVFTIAFLPLYLVFSQSAAMR